jgi:predicted RNase H-like HicB family nuclease
MAQPETTLYIDVEYNTEDEEYGPMYIATNDMIGLVTDGKSFEELRENLKDALDACLGDIDTIAEYNLVANPRIELRMLFAYGETA